MQNKPECTCPLCQKGGYNSADYFVDMSFLRKERPIGVSGLLRVKNDAEFLSDCIESCIGALDELIICYQDCTDRAPEIIHEKAQKYPDKIKVYYYAPPVYCWGLTEEEIQDAFSLPDTSIHKLCNYYNYTLSKATYRYAMKIDSDQVYFADKLKRFCDAYRKEGKVSMSEYDYQVKKYFWRYREHVTSPFLYRLDLFSRIPAIRNWIFRKYEDYLIKEIINTKYALSLSGINLGYENGKWGNYMLNKSSFNGEMDHLIFQITEDTFYTTFVGRKNPIEIMKYHKPILFGGWFWYHLQGMRQNMPRLSKEVLALKLKPISKFADWSDFHKRMFLFFWAYERNIPAPDQILKETIYNISNRQS